MKIMTFPLGKIAKNLTHLRLMNNKLDSNSITQLRLSQLFLLKDLDLSENPKIANKGFATLCRSDWKDLQILNLCKIGLCTNNQRKGGLSSYLSKRKWIRIKKLNLDKNIIRPNFIVSLIEQSIPISGDSPCQFFGTISHVDKQL